MKILFLLLIQVIQRQKLKFSCKGYKRTSWNQVIQSQISSELTMRIHEWDLGVTASENVGSARAWKQTRQGKKWNTKTQKCFHAIKFKGSPFIQHHGSFPTFILHSVQQNYKSSKETASMLERATYTRFLSLQKCVTGNVKKLRIFNRGTEKVRINYSLCLQHSLDVLTAIAAAVVLKDLLQKSEFLMH